MIFFLIRIAPFILPVIYLGLLRLLFVFPSSWPTIFVLTVLINGAYFILLWLRLGRQRVWLSLLYSEIFLMVGLVGSILFDSPVIIGFFTILWALAYLIYLESIFNYFHRIEKKSIFDLKGIGSYLNLALVFFAVSCLLDFYIFLSLNWWWVIILAFLVIMVVLLDRFAFLGLPLKTNLIYSSVIAVILVEILGSLLFWPSSLYVLSAVVSIFYYVFVSLASAFLAKVLTKKLFWRYFIFLLAFLIIVLSTARWL